MKPINLNPYKTLFRFVLPHMFLIILIFSGYPGFCGQSLSKKDSLNIEKTMIQIKNASHDTTKLRLLMNLAESVSDEKVWPGFNSRAYKLANKLSLFEDEEIRKKGKEGLAGTLNNMGYFNAEHEKPELALHYFQRALKLQKELGNSEAVAYSLNNIGFVYNGQGYREKALEYYLQALVIHEKAKNGEGIAYEYNNIGIIYESQQNLDLALEYYIRALNIREKLKKPQILSSSLNNVGLIYLYKGNLDKAMALFLRANEVMKKSDEKSRNPTIMNNIGLIYSRKGDLKKAMEYYDLSLKIEEEQNRNPGISSALNNIGVLFLRMDNPTEALQYCRRSLEIGKELNYPLLIARAAQSLSMIFEALAKKVNMNNNKKWEYTASALEHYKLYKTMSDTIFNAKKTMEIGKIEGKYEFEKKLENQKLAEAEMARKIATVKKRRFSIQYSGIGIGILLLIVLSVIIGRFRIKIKFIEGLVFVSVLLLFEFVMIIADPWSDRWLGGEPALKFLFNAILALGIFPLHNLMEKQIKKIIFHRQKQNS